MTMTKHVAYNAILALGMLFVFVKGGIDLSIGSTVGLSGIVAGVLLQGLKIENLNAVLSPRSGSSCCVLLLWGLWLVPQRGPGDPVQCCTV